MNVAKKICFVLVAVLMTTTVTSWASSDKPGKGITVTPARATWNTGYFQEAIVSRALTELGYKVKNPTDYTNPIFYKSLAMGDLDYWCNGWFPMHNSELPKDFNDKAEKIGYVVKAGGLQGYLVSKKAVEKYNIKSLADFKREEVKKAFDKNHDGKADLTACPPGWGCEKVINHHLKVYNLEDDINPVKASYEAGMAAAIGAYKSDDPIFFYTWTPNWTVFKLKPGQDVMWINVPEINPTEAQAVAKDMMTQTGVKGAVTDPVKLGFVVSDIRIVANKKFLADNPAAKKFFEIFNLSLADINAQNTRLNQGEKSAKDIQKHVTEWIAKNQAQWDDWLAQARAAAAK